MDRIEEMKKELQKVKNMHPEFSFVLSKRRVREPEFYKLYIYDEWIGELWDNQEGHLWTNLVSKQEREEAPLLHRGKTLQHPSTQVDVLYVKETNSVGGFKCAMSFSSLARTCDVMEAMLQVKKGKVAYLSSRKYVENEPVPTVSGMKNKNKETLEKKEVFKDIQKTGKNYIKKRRVL